MTDAHDDSVHYRLVTEVRELSEVVELQKMVWGPDPVSSMQHMRAAILHGGAVIGAFCKEALVGFCYGFIGYDGKSPYVGSHMMAIHPAYRDRGVGMRLKLEQRLWAMQDISKIVWTFDPFESRNAYLNIYKLGGTVSTYIPNFYGIDTVGYPTDRFLVEWMLSSDRVVHAINRQHKLIGDTTDYPQLLEIEYTDGKVTGIVDMAAKSQIGKSHGLRLPIPQAASKIRQAQPDLYKVWQQQFRELAMAAFANGYEVVSCQQPEPEVQDYVLEMKL